VLKPEVSAIRVVLTILEIYYINKFYSQSDIGGSLMKTAIRIAILGPGLLLASAALADHNSRWGEGWANMPNDIHNTRVETLGDNTTFRDFVRYGDGAESINRFADSSTRAKRVTGRSGMMGGGRQGR
jgi:hypothetical protein